VTRGCGDRGSDGSRGRGAPGDRPLHTRHRPRRPAHGADPRSDRTGAGDHPAARPAGDAKKPERRALLRKELFPYFNFEEMSRRSLGIHWKNRTPQERQEFVKLFTDLLENSYAGKIEGYKGEKILFGKESLDLPYAEVKTAVVTPQGQEFSVDYRLLADGSRCGYTTSSSRGESREQLPVPVRGDPPEILLRGNDEAAEGNRPEAVQGVMEAPDDHAHRAVPDHRARVRRVGGPRENAVDPTGHVPAPRGVRREPRCDYGDRGDAVSAFRPPKVEEILHLPTGLRFSVDG